MSNFITLLAQANDTGSDGSAVLGFLILFGFLYAIYKAMTKKKTYDVRIGGTVRER